MPTSPSEVDEASVVVPSGSDREHDDDDDNDDDDDVWDNFVKSRRRERAKRASFERRRSLTKTIATSAATRARERLQSSATRGQIAASLRKISEAATDAMAATTTTTTAVPKDAIEVSDDGESAAALANRNDDRPDNAVVVTPAIARRLTAGDGISIESITVNDATIVREPSKHVRYAVRVVALVRDAENSHLASRETWTVTRRMAQFKALHASLKFELVDVPRRRGPPASPFDSGGTSRASHASLSRRNSGPFRPFRARGGAAGSATRTFVRRKVKLDRYVRSLFQRRSLRKDGIGECLALRTFVQQETPGGRGVSQSPRRGCYCSPDGRLHLGLVVDRQHVSPWLSMKEQLATQGTNVRVVARRWRSACSAEIRVVCASTRVFSFANAAIATIPA